MTPYTSYLLSEVCIEAGLPKGVLNIIHGLGGKAGQAIIEHPEIKAISFTGGTETGKRIAATAAPMFKKLSLEVGDTNDAASNQGAIVSLAHKQKVLSYIQLATEEGGKILTGGHELKLEGR